MPVWLRNFTFNKIKEYYDKQDKEANGGDVTEQTVSNLKAAGATANEVQVPSYVAKASKK